MKLFVLLWKAWFAVLNIVCIIFIAPVVIVLSNFKNTFNIIYFFIKLWANIVFYGIGMRYELHAIQQLKKEEQYMIVSNHTSVLDIMLMIVLHPNDPLTFVGKKELEKVPLFGTAYKRVCVMVDRNSQKSKVEVYRRSLEKINEGRSMVIFPEGGVTEEEDQNLLPFKDGAFKIAKMAEIPLVIYTIIGLKEAFPFQFWKGHPMKIKVFRERIYSREQVITENEKEIKDTAFELIDERLKKAQSIK